jgi:NADH:ubiquinone oxidoreductase subunit C
MKMNNLIKLGTLFPIIKQDLNSNENVIIVSCKHIISALMFLKLHTNFQYKLLTCISGVDYIGCKYRFGVIYEILSLRNNNRLRVKVFVNEITPVDSVINVYVNSN